MSFEKIKDKHVELMTEKKAKTTADEMFEELGYKKTIDEPNLIYYERYSDKHMIFTVEFKEGEVLISNLLHRVAWAKPKLHLAIVEKIKELGWLE